MSELTDLEICKRIAEIEGKEYASTSDGVYVIGELFGKEYKELYSPLTSKALCFDLMVKYELDVQAPFKPHDEINWEVNYSFNAYSDAGVVYDENLQRAICLAVIEKHEAL